MGFFGWVFLGGFLLPTLTRLQGVLDTTLQVTIYLLVSAEEAGVMSLLDYHEGDARLVVRLQLDASLAYCGQLVL